MESLPTNSLVDESLRPAKKQALDPGDDFTEPSSSSQELSMVRELALYMSNIFLILISWWNWNR